MQEPEKFQVQMGLEAYESYILSRKRIIVLCGAIGEESHDDCGLGLDNVEWVVRKLEYLSEISKEPIKIVLNSVGGDVYSGLLVYDTIINVRNKGVKVIIEVRGLAASMGAVILQAASERIATEHTRFLIHEISSIAWGKASEVAEQAEELKKLNALLRRIIAERTGKTEEEIEKIWKKKDVWMSAEEALQFGLIDRIERLKPEWERVHGE